MGADGRERLIMTASGKASYRRKGVSNTRLKADLRCSLEVQRSRRQQIQGLVTAAAWFTDDIFSPCPYKVEGAEDSLGSLL